MTLQRVVVRVVDGKRTVEVDGKALKVGRLIVSASPGRYPTVLAELVPDELDVEVDGVVRDF